MKSYRSVFVVTSEAKFIFLSVLTSLLKFPPKPSYLLNTLSHLLFINFMMNVRGLGAIPFLLSFISSDIYICIFSDSILAVLYLCFDCPLSI